MSPLAKDQAKDHERDPDIFRRGGFDITKVVGYVDFNMAGEHHPTEVAFRIIGEDASPGTYVFPDVEKPKLDFVVTIEKAPRAGRE